MTAAEAPVSRFVLGPEVARGGMAAVHVAVDSATGDTVALKLLLGESTPEVRGRFLREVRSTSALQSAHVCRLIAWGVDGQSYLAMELIDGPTLSTIASNARAAAAEDVRNALPARAVAEVLRQLLEGLAVAHEAGVLHRDLKPGNVMVTRDGVVKLLDFGIARTAGDGTLTKTGELIGTPAFMSPEQVRGEPLDARSDLFSLGLTIQAFIRGTHRFRGLDTRQMLMRAMNEPTAPLLEEAPAMPLALDNVLAALTQASPGSRVRDARTALSLLQATGLVPARGEALLAEIVADQISGTHAACRRENEEAAARELVLARDLMRRPGAETAAFLALDRAATLNPESEAVDDRKAWASRNNFSLDEPRDPEQRARVAALVEEAAAEWRRRGTAAAACRRIADFYGDARCPRMQSVFLWRYVRERPDDEQALARLRILLDGPEQPGLTHARLSTRSIVAGIITGGKLAPSPATAEERSPQRERPRSQANDDLRVVFTPDVERRAVAAPLVIGLLIVAAVVLVVRMTVDTAVAARDGFERFDRGQQERDATVASRAGVRMSDEMRDALDKKNWILARTLASEVLNAPASLIAAQEARAVRARASMELGDRASARVDLEAYVVRVTYDDPFLPEANRMLSSLREPLPPPTGGLR